GPGRGSGDPAGNSHALLQRADIRGACTPRPGLRVRVAAPRVRSGRGAGDAGAGRRVGPAHGGGAEPAAPAGVTGAAPLQCIGFLFGGHDEDGVTDRVQDRVVDPLALLGRRRGRVPEGAGAPRRRGRGRAARWVGGGRGRGG